jgi:hypothetical protein
MVAHRVVGMDPYIEAQAWRDFHTNFIVGIQDALMPQLAPKYIVRIEERVYVDEEMDIPHVRFADVAVETSQPDIPHEAGSIATTPKPALRTIPMLVEQRERFIEIYTREGRQLVTVIELLSPANKRPNSVGRREYLEKRRQLIQAGINLVEIDLLLQGEHMPTNEPLPEGDYFVLVARAYQLPVVAVYYWRLGQPMPTVPIPLLREDPEACLNMQAVYEQVYARARYDLQLDLSQPLPDSR